MRAIQRATSLPGQLPLDTAQKAISQRASTVLILRWNKPLHSRQVHCAHSVLSLGFTPAYSAGDLLLQHLEAFEQEAEEKGGVQQSLADHFARVHKVNMALRAAA